MRSIIDPIYTLRPYERGIQEKQGKYHRFILPGLGFQIPLITEHGISPTLLLGSLPVNLTTEDKREPSITKSKNYVFSLERQENGKPDSMPKMQENDRN